jgi:hypothetical protein
VTGHDLDGDGRPDALVIERGGRTFCRRIDLNFDGQLDMIRFFDAEGRATREGMDLDFDGRIDAVSTDDGTTTGMDMDSDGRPDAWRVELEGGIVEERRDLDGDGRVDSWTHVDRSGALVWTSRDDDGDGAPDAPRRRAPRP